MKIRRTFKGRKFDNGGTNSDCKNGMIWDASQGKCVQPPNTVWNAMTGMYEPTATSQQNDKNPLVQNPNAQEKGTIMLSPEDLRGEQNSEIDLLSEEGMNMMEMEDEISEINSFAKELDSQQKADAALKGASEFEREKQLAYDDATAEEVRPTLPDKKSQLINPYAGVDIPTAAYLAGENWGKDGDRTTAVAASAKFLLGSARNFFSGMGAANVNAQGVENYNDEVARSKRTEFVPLEDGGTIKSDIDAIFNDMKLPAMKDGGDVDIKMMTGNYATGSNNGDENVELEKDEFLQEPGGTPKKVEGKTHEQSDENGTGEKMNLPDDTDVISDNLKPNKEQRNKIKEAFDIKVKAKDTYAEALEKYNKKIGLSDLIDEEEEIIKEIKTQKEKMAEEGADEATSNINLEFLSTKLKDIGDEKMELQNKSKEAFDVIFQLQEESKPKEEQAQTEFKIGGKVYNQDQIIEVADKYGIDQDRAMSIVKKMEDGGSTDNDRREDLIRQARSLGYEGDLSPENIEENIGKIQAFLAKEKPNEVIKYFKGPDGIAITAKGIDMLKKNNPKLFKELDFDLSKPSASFTESERKSLQQAAQEKNIVDDKFFLEQFQDGRWEYRFPIISPEIPIEPTSTKPLSGEASLGQIKQSSIEKKKQNEEELVGENFTGDTENLNDDGEAGIDEDTKKQIEKTMNAILLPDNSPLPPQGLQMPTKVNRRYGRADLQAVNPEGRLAELDRVFDAATQKLEGLPSGQKEAMLVKAAANKADRADKIIESYNTQQNQLDQSEQAFNIRQGDREEDANAVDLLDYERRVFGALANTEDDFRRFYNTAQERNIQNFNTINSLNLLNQAYDNFDFGNQGVALSEGTNMSLEDIFNSNQFKQAVRASNPAQTTSTSEKKTKKARRGGRIKRKY